MFIFKLHHKIKQTFELNKRLIEYFIASVVKKSTAPAFLWRGRL